MSDQKRWNERYVNNELPWETGCPDTYLVRMVSRWPLHRGLALEVGCGTGTNSIWLAEQGFEVLGIDLSSEAVAIAGRRAKRAGVACRFVSDNFLTCELEPESCFFVFDRGCFHSMHDAASREGFAAKVVSCLNDGGLWLSLIGNADDAVRDKGPPRLAAREIVDVVESRFEILSLESCLIESRRGEPPRFWRCLMRKRA